MPHRTITIVLLVAAGCTEALAYVRAYAVDPVKAQWSGWTRTLQGQNQVSEVITCNFDSLCYVELFAGEPTCVGRNAV